MIAIGLVRGRYDNLSDSGTAATGIQDAPGSADVGFKARQWIAMRNVDDCLGREMEHGIDFIFTEHSLERALLADVPPRDGDSAERALREQSAGGGPVAYQTHNLCAVLQQPVHEPAAKQTRRAGDQDRSVSPERQSH